MAGPKRRLSSDINVVPYIDVMLVLLVIFMVTAPMLMQGVKVELPQAATEPVEDQQDEPVIVSIKADGSYYINLGVTPKKPVELALIKQKISAIMASKPKTAVMVWGDTNVPYGSVIKLMSQLQQSGVPNVGLVTQPPSDL